VTSKDKDNLLNRNTMIFYWVAIGSALVIVATVFLTSASGASGSYAGVETPNASRIVELTLQEDGSGMIVLSNNQTLQFYHNFLGTYIFLEQRNITNSTGATNNSSNLSSIAIPIQEEEEEEDQDQESSDSDDSDGSSSSTTTTIEEEEQEEDPQQEEQPTEEQPEETPQDPPSPTPQPQTGSETEEENTNTPPTTTTPTTEPDENIEREP
jgi:hypothetical protein